ncbi:MAG: zinc-dependent metalloprotease, partial [Chitinophagaceae bacterium]|nr:zinc-dependent metalloprotease [Chitinophagaceae bacterium]
AVKEIPDSNYFEFQSAQSTIHYIQSNMENATYSFAVDPRSGQILQSHIFFSSEVEKQIDRNYIFQMLLTDPRVSFSGINDSIMGELIRRMITHEVGHSLGFNHNFYASYAVNVEDYRNRDSLMKNGLTPSIMDYARYNYIAQPVNGIDFDKGLIYSIGKYDEWALKWGYTYYDNSISSTEQQSRLNTMLKLRNQSPVYFYLPKENDCRAVAESLGNDHCEASRYGMNTLEKIARRYISESGGLDSARKLQLNTGLYFTYSNYINHVLSDFTNPVYSIDPAGKETYSYLPVAKQENAIAFLNEYAFRLPKWFYETLDNMGSDSLKEAYLKNIAIEIIMTLLNQEKLIAMTDKEHLGQSETVFALVRTALSNSRNDSLNAGYRKELQSAYLRRMKRAISLNMFDSNSNAAKLLKREIAFFEPATLTNNPN